ncbi:MAG: hypothetical protein RR191_01780 [Cetobacterium sp.]|uniref:hypothetical protein n=1 Tax=unclassified Cetobacterium TaxID=2630983 RepID=UPI00163C0E4A|nr:hypothetical protein [Cetobacterium sp. 2A]MBC2855779.1 hypothetical protein [Cetobacterium sp. 2A]
MKKIISVFTIKNIYLISVVYFFYGYFFTNFLDKFSFYEKIKNYLGVFQLLFLIVLAVSPFPMYMKNKKKKIVLKTRLIFFVIFCFSVVYGYLLDLIYKLDSISDIESYIIEMGVFDYNIGTLPTYLLLEIYNRFEKKWIYSVLGFLIFLSVLILIAKEVRITVCAIINAIRNRRERIKKEKLLKEQIAIKEYQEKLEISYVEALEKQREKDIQDAVEEAIQNNLVLKQIEEETEEIVKLKIILNEDLEETEKVEEFIEEETEILLEEEKVEEIETEKVEDEEKTEEEEEIEKNDTSIQVS